MTNSDKTPQYLTLVERNHIMKPLLGLLQGLSWDVIDLHGKEHKESEGIR
jgi:hypothetical protein